MNCINLGYAYSFSIPDFSYYLLDVFSIGLLFYYYYLENVRKLLIRTDLSI